MEKLELRFTLERPTKNTIRYQEEPGEYDVSVGTLYIQKPALGNPAPQRLKVTIEPEA